MQTKQRLDVPLTLKSVSDNGEFEGYGSVFGVEDSYGDVVIRGGILGQPGQVEREGPTASDALAAPDE